MMKYKDMLCVNNYRINLPRIQINIVILLCFIYIYIYIGIGHKSKEHMNGDFEESLWPSFISVLVNVFPSLIVRMRHFI